MKKKKEKIILAFTFLLALLPIILPWIDLGPAELVGARRGLRYLGIEFYIAAALFYLLLFMGKRWGMLLSQLAVLLSYGVALYMFPVRSNLGSAPDWNLAWQTLAWPFWLAVGAMAAHMALTCWLTKEE